MGRLDWRLVTAMLVAAAAIAMIARDCRGEIRCRRAGNVWINRRGIVGGVCVRAGSVMP